MKRPYCQCLFEIENGLPRTKFCRKACKDQGIILGHKIEIKDKEGEPCSSCGKGTLILVSNGPLDLGAYLQCNYCDYIP